jgi:hypothetical protein
LRPIKVAWMPFIVAIAVGALPASALAKSLVVEELATPLAPGTTVQGRLQLTDVTPESNRQCEAEWIGELVTNKLPTDRLAMSPASTLCLSNTESLSEVGSTILLGANGKASVRFMPKLEYRLPGPCVYPFRRMAGRLEPQVAQFAGFVSGKLNRKASTLSCASTLTVSFFVTLYQINESLNLEVRG